MYLIIYFVNPEAIAAFFPHCKCLTPNVDNTF